MREIEVYEKFTNAMGLKNRTYLYDNLLNIIDGRIYCIYIDLDNFKDVNVYN